MGRDLTPHERADLFASRHHGAINLAQALEAGLTPDEIRYNLRSGRWRRATRAVFVFVVVGAPATWQQAVTVACLAGPDGTVASHFTAAALFGLWTPPSRPHVTVPRPASGRCRVAVVHHARLRPEDTSVIGTIPCTRPARILVDCATLLGYDALCELVDDILCRELTRVTEVREAIDRASRAPGRKGLPTLQQALEVWTPGPRPGSRGEMRLVRRVVDWGFPAPERQVVVRDGAGRFVAKADLGWPDRRTLLEYDGGRHHGPRQQPHDQDRQARIEALGWRVERARKADVRPGATRLRSVLLELFEAV
jgi:hypothetical protein